MKIIYLLGRGRSGSTLLSHLLGSQDHIINVGELKNFRTYHLRTDHRDRLCSDGVPLSLHPFWLKIRQDMIDTTSEEFPDLQTRDRRNFRRFNLAMYDAIRNESGADVIVDASKKFTRLLRLRPILGKDLHVVYMVKDPRAYSLSIEKSNTRKLEKSLQKECVARKLLWWNFYNLIVLALIKSHFIKANILKYERLASHPEAVIRAVLDEAGATRSTIELDYHKKKQPVFSGNVYFLEKCTGKIEFDYSHLQKLSTTEWIKRTVLTFPANVLLRYPISRKAYLE